MWQFLLSLMSLIILCVKEFYSQAAKAEAGRVAFKINQEQMKKIVDAAVSNWHMKNSEDSAKINKAWDESEKK